MLFDRCCDFSSPPCTELLAAARGTILKKQAKSLCLFSRYVCQEKKKKNGRQQLLSCLKCVKIIMAFFPCIKKFVFLRVNNGTTSETITAGSKYSNSNIPDDTVHLCVWSSDRISFILFTHKCCFLEQSPSSEIIKNHSKFYVEMNQSVSKHENME